MVEQRMSGRLAGYPQHAAEATRIVVPNDGAVVENDVKVIVLQNRRRYVDNRDRARHTEMPENKPTARLRADVDQQVFSPSRDGLYQSARDELREIGGDWPAKAAVAHHDAAYVAAANARQEPDAGCFYFWQLWHKLEGLKVELNCDMRERR